MVNRLKVSKDFWKSRQIFRGKRLSNEFLNGDTSLPRFKTFATLCFELAHFDHSVSNCAFSGIGD